MAEILCRREERASLDELLTGARAGRSGVVVLRGEAGIGKTALVDHVGETATRTGFTVRPVAAAEAEVEFAFAGLHQLCAPLLDRAAALPEPQRAALDVAFGLREGTPPAPLLVGLAVLSLLAEAAEEAPLLCLVDDAQWLDQASAQVLGFVARRVSAESMALVLAVRDGDEAHPDPFAGLPELRVGGLGEADARALLRTTLGAPLAEDVRDRIVAEARGNPLALLELPRGAQLAGGYELPDALSVPDRVEASFRRRSAALPAETQLLLLVAAAEPTGDPGLMWRAVDHLGIDRGAATPAEAVGLLTIDSRVRFPHPLVRSAVYRAAPTAEQRRAHGALGAATDPDLDPDRRAWHLARSVLGADEAVAAQLEASAGRARARGGLSAAAAFLQRAAELTPEPAARASRALVAAYTKHEVGAFAEVAQLMAVAAAGPLDPLQRARLQLLRAQIGFLASRDSAGSRGLLEAASTLAPLDPLLSRDTFLQALDTAGLTGGPGDGRGVRDVAEAARAVPRPPGAPRPADLLLDGFVALHLQGYEAGAPLLRQAVTAYRAEDLQVRGVVGEDDRRRTPSGSGAGPLEAALEQGRWPRTALTLFDDESFWVLTDRAVRLAREAGALVALHAVLLLNVFTLTLGGRFAEAVELADEQAALARAIGAAPLRHTRLVLAAWRGDEAAFAPLYAACVSTTPGQGEATEASTALQSQAVLQSALGNYPAALDAAERAARANDVSIASSALPDLVEAACRTGQMERAVEATGTLSARAAASGTEWALGLAARCQALTSAGPEAEKYYREALERLGRCRVAVELVRAHLVYGEWLRREGRRQEAREQLRAAHRMASDMGADAFADRAARELRATGEHPRARTAQQTDELTVQELQVARLVATGATSREVATQLFLSPRTIEAHLRNIFRKLGITSRRQLRNLPLP